MSKSMPAVFVGHGNPMNAVRRNRYSDAWAHLGKSISRPSTILCISAHWYLPGLAVTAVTAPRTIHDFGGFPPELYEVAYPAPGSPQLANRVRNLLSPLRVELSEEWGLDHGSWSILCHMFPEADIPVVQLSIDETQPPSFHYQIGKLLAPLRDEGVLILGSGNIIHNLHSYAWGKHEVEPFAWAVRFETLAKEFLIKRNDQPLVSYEALGRDAVLSAPTPDHYLPLLYVLGSGKADDEVTFPVEGFDGGSISMLSVQFG